jgi:hypothetical protein
MRKPFIVSSSLIRMHVFICAFAHTTTSPSCSRSLRLEQSLQKVGRRAARHQ